MSRSTGTSEALIQFIRAHYESEEFIPLHAPVFRGNEKAYLAECIDSTFVSSVGKFVDEAEKRFAEFIGAPYAVAVTNGTAALHLALHLAGVKDGEEVLTQALTFVATGNAIRYQRAQPVFLDVDRDSLSLSPRALQDFLEKQTEERDGQRFNRASGKKIAACVPMHTFGHVARIAEIAAICESYGVPLVEDAAESIGSYEGKTHTGNFGQLASFSFNGNKTITCGGGGMITTQSEALAKRAKHLSTVAKRPHPYEFYHEELAFNYRMPNVNAALLLAQLEQLPEILENKRATAQAYADFCKGRAELEFIAERPGTRANYWLNVVLTEDLAARDQLLKKLNEAGVMSRPAWILLNELPEFKDCESDKLSNSRWLYERLINLPSSVKSGHVA